MSTYSQIIRDGLWHNNVVFGQLLALCPLLAVTSTATNGLGMGLASTAVLVGSNLLVSMTRSLISPKVRIPIFVLLIATLVSLVDMTMNAWLHDLHKMLGLFIPLIVTNCAILGRAEAFASRQPVLPSIVDGLMMGIGFTLALVLLGATREILGSGTLFANASLLLGSGFTGLELVLFEDYQGIVLMLLPPGGFLALGFLIVAKRLLDRRFEQRPTNTQANQITVTDLDESSPGGETA
ncbi:electron transport complex subunit E [Amphritea balenae]|uniref:Ion-translocating oxidoreductase complex subunit E n=1 Tax=Amphritea balenae TaxID=452629 RepID=A0A3P1SM83_9GAMM|nr:electron transport complex subunit E [Amphritea balenae]RRC98024.1 electron transport complex subunit E [Amphritea balenae]GGK66905.1 electron transport complex subunit RnfE [Amphritea balenae]